MHGPKTIHNIYRTLKPASLTSRLLFIVGIISVYVHSRIFRRPFKVKIPLEYRKRAFYVKLSNLDDIDALDEIFIEEIYKPLDKINPGPILDMGANIGLSGIYFAIKYPELTVMCLEPAVQVLEDLIFHASQFNNMIVIPKAVSSTDGQRTLFVSNKRSHSSSLLERAVHDTEVTVEVVSIKSLLNISHLDRFSLIKFDIEGEEYNILDGIQKNTFQYVGELHLDLIPDGLVALDKILDYDNFHIEYNKEIKRPIIRASIKL